MSFQDILNKRIEMAKSKNQFNVGDSLLTKLNTSPNPTFVIVEVREAEYAVDVMYAGVRQYSTAISFDDAHTDYRKV